MEILIKLLGALFGVIFSIVAFAYVWEFIRDGRMMETKDILKLTPWLLLIVVGFNSLDICRALGWL